MDSHEVSIGKYLGALAVGYLLGLVIINLLQNIFHLYISPLWYFAVLLIAAYLVAGQFVKQHQRALSGMERNILCGGGIVTAIVITVLDMLLVMRLVLDAGSYAAFINDLKIVPTGSLLIYVGSAAVIGFALLWLVFGPLTNMAAKK